MTNKEREILEIIKADPTIEQSEIAELLHISRSTVAVHISSLQKQGYLLGKGYIINDESYIVGIGASNVDVYGTSRIPIRTHYDHPADIRSSIGGVMHNIITNYVRLEGKARMITAYGDDSYGKSIIEDFQKNQIDYSDSLQVNGASSGVFMQVMDENNDMYLAICDMSILDHITPDYLRSKEKIIANAGLVVIDPSLSNEAIEEIIDICKDRVGIYIDPISDNLALKVRPYIPYFDLIKPNRGELENLCGKKIRNDDDLYAACQSLLDQGLKKIVTSMSENGILYMDKERRYRKKFREEKRMVNASGAGDALMAALIYGEVNDLSVEETVDYGLAAGIAAVGSAGTINENMSVTLLDEIIKENRK